MTYAAALSSSSLTTGGRFSVALLFFTAFYHAVAAQTVALPPECAPMMLSSIGRPHDLGFSVSVKQQSFAPGDILEVHVHGRSRFRGIRLYALGGWEEQLVGDWFPPVRGLQRKYRAVSCSSQQLGGRGGGGSVVNNNVIITERRKFTRKKTPLRFAWASPMTCGLLVGGSVLFRAVIIVNSTVYQSVNASLESSCTEDYQTVDTCRERPAQGIESYNTSFEVDHGRTTGPHWVDSGERTWTKRRMWTPSYHTGPNGAYNGRTYIYSEASRVKALSKAVLSTSSHLRGCFCLRFALSMNIRANAGHVFQVRDNQGVVFSVSARNAVWQLQEVQFNEIWPTQIFLEAIRGRNWLGDIALDDLSMYGGRCQLLENQDA